MNLEDIFSPSKISIRKENLEIPIHKVEHNFDVTKIPKDEEEAADSEVKIKTYSTKYVARLGFKSEMLIDDEVFYSEEERKKAEELICKEMQRHVAHILYGKIAESLREIYREARYMEAFNRDGSYGRGGTSMAQKISDIITAIDKL